MLTRPKPMLPVHMALMWKRFSVYLYNNHYTMVVAQKKPFRERNGLVSSYA